MATNAPTSIEFVPDPAAMNRLLRSSSGHVVRGLMRDGDRVRQLARQKVGVSKPDPVPRRRPHKPGTLRDSIVVRLVTIAGEPEVLVGVFSGEAKTYARFVHEGSVAHIIRGRPGKPLVFYWQKAGRIVAVQSVRHPGTRPNRYLTDALREALR